MGDGDGETAKGRTQTKNERKTLDTEKKPRLVYSTPQCTLVDCGNPYYDGASGFWHPFHRLFKYKDWWTLDYTYYYRHIWG
jgi:hypothetical protein